MLAIQDAIQCFLHDLAIGQSPETVQTYSQGLERFAEFLTSTEHSPLRDTATLAVDHALGFARWLAEDREREVGPVSKATLRTYLASLSRFYAYLLRENLIELTAADLERMRDAFRRYRQGYHRGLPKLPPEAAVHALLQAARSTAPESKDPRLELARLRNIAILEALRSSGMRVGELVRLVRDDLDYRAHTARVTGKGNKQRVVYFDDTAWDAIQRYLQARADGAKGRAMYKLPVFSRHDRGSGKQTLPLTTETVRRVFSQLARDANLQITLTPHSFRHAFATKVLEATGDLAVVQDMLGHASPETTRIYAQVSSKRIRDAHRAAFGYDDDD